MSREAGRATVRAERLLAVDIGNTQVCLGLYERGRLRREFHLPSDARLSGPAWQRQLADLLGRAGIPAGNWTGACLASVVPDITPRLRRALSALQIAPMLEVTPGLHLPVANRYQPPEAVGADRLVNAVAAVAEFGAPVIVVDLGTAITVDAVSSGRAYIGGAILPGLGLALRSLAQGTALLPEVDLRAPRGAWGRSTEESMLAGVVYGAAGAVTRLVQGLREHLGPRTPVVATGGQSAWISRFCPILRRVRPHLTLEGLRQIWEWRHGTSRRGT